MERILFLRDCDAIRENENSILLSSESISEEDVIFLNVSLLPDQFESLRGARE